MLTDGLPSAVAAKVTGQTKRKRGTRSDYVTLRAVYSYQGIEYPINTIPSSGCHTQPLSEMIRRIVGAVERYKRVMFIRLDLSVIDYEETNESLSAFLKQAVRHVRRKYKTRLEYVWAREQKKAKRQHYHLALLIDGDKIRYPTQLYEELGEKWRKGRLSIPKSPYLMTDGHNIAEAVYRVSYLTKERGKGYRRDGVRDFDWSRFTPPPHSNNGDSTVTNQR